MGYATTYLTGTPHNCPSREKQGKTDADPCKLKVTW